MGKYPQKKIILTGYTDNIGDKDNNQKLSQQRADFIRDIIRKALNKNRLAPERVSSIGYGDNRPIAANNTLAGRQKNRRIEISFH